MDTVVIDNIPYVQEEVFNWDITLLPDDLYIIKNRTLYRLTVEDTTKNKSKKVVITKDQI